MAEVSVTPMLNVVTLSAGYHGSAVVRDLSLYVNPGEIVTLLGPNGAGKTTTLLTIFGMLKPLAGTIHVNGKSTADVPAHLARRAGIGYVPEGRALAPSLTVHDNLRLVDNWTGDPYDVFPELGPLKDRRVGLLSGGEQQMLAVARALLTGPSLLLVDELSFGLAPILVDRLLERLRASADNDGLAVLLVEQHVRHALRFADRAYVLSHGELVLRSSAIELVADPTLLTAAYLGNTAEVV